MGTASAPAGDATFKMTNKAPYTIILRFFSQNRNWIWPDANRHYILDDDQEHDIRLACHGIDADDNEFVIGLVGKELHPLSHLVQTMRKTRQTSEFIAKMGPFFVGHVAHRSA